MTSTDWTPISREAMDKLSAGLVAAFHAKRCPHMLYALISADDKFHETDRKYIWCEQWEGHAKDGVSHIFLVPPDEN